MSAARNAGKQRWRVDEARGIAFRSPALEQGLDGVEYFLFSNCGHVHSHPFGWWVSIGVQTGPPIGAQMGPSYEQAQGCSDTSPCAASGVGRAEPDRRSAPTTEYFYRWSVGVIYCGFVRRSVVSWQSVLVRV